MIFLNNQDTGFKRYKTAILYFILGLVISVVLFLLIVFSLGAFFSINLIQEYKNYELANKGENVGYIFESRADLGEYQNIIKEKNDFHTFSLEKIETKEITHKAIVDSEIKGFSDEYLFIHGRYSYTTSDGTEPLKIENTDYNLPTVCVQDWFDDGDYHGEIVYSYIKSLYDGPVYLIDNNEIDFNTNKTYSFYEQCDIVNMSIQYPILYTQNSFLNNIGKNVDNGNTIFIYASGNDLYDSSKKEQKLTRHKLHFQEEAVSKYPNLQKNIPNYLIGVTQGIIDMDDDSAKNVFSGGKGVDFVVFNADLYADDTKILGTSFASPFVTAMAANLLKAGVPKDEVKNMLYSDYYLQDKDNKYGVVLSDDIQEKVNYFK